MVKKVVIVGAGPSGLLLAHYLLRRGDSYQIDIYERRSDPRTASFSKSRTFPLSLGERGMSALRNIAGLEEAVKAISIEITGTLFRPKNGKIRFTSRKQPLFTLDRTSLVMVLLDKLTEKYDSSRLTIHFEYECTQVDFAAKTVTFQNVAEAQPEGADTDLSVKYDWLIGADGARSAVRKHVLGTEGFECEQRYIPTDYKSIFLPRPDENSEIHLASDKLHTWRLDDGTALLLLHQASGTLSGVVHFPHEKNLVIGLSTTQEVIEFFHENFREVGQLIPESEAEAFLKRPASKILTTRCNRYHHGDSVLILGDAAHSVSPSIGQGCNAALEDVVVLDRLLDEYSDNLAEAIAQFTVRRQPDGQALVELSDYTFPSSTGLFFQLILRERLAKFLHNLFPKRFSPSLLELVSDTITPYSEILKLHQGWISKVKKSNEKLVESL